MNEHSYSKADAPLPSESNFSPPDFSAMIRQQCRSELTAAVAQLQTQLAAATQRIDLLQRQQDTDREFLRTIAWSLQCAHDLYRDEMTSQEDVLCHPNPQPQSRPEPAPKPTGER